MRKKCYLLSMVMLFLSFFYCDSRGKTDEREIIDKVASWQIEHHGECRYKKLHWTNATLYRGMFAWAEYTGNKDYFDFIRNIGEDHNWSLLKRRHHADDMCMGQTYVLMYEKFGDEKMIFETKRRMDYVVHHPSDVDINLGVKEASDRWSWCDALFMAAPAYVQMYNIFGDEKYLQFLDREFKNTVECLYDKEYHLFYRDVRFFKKKEKNGKPVFWGRGNGWVYASLAFILEGLPKDHYTYDYYLNLYKDMTQAVLECQDKDGSWHTSMLDHKAYPDAETSSSSLFTFGLAYGVNSGILKGKEYKQAAVKGWEALKTYVREDGCLGNVQPIAAAAGKDVKDNTEVYGVGAFLLAGTEMMKMDKKKASKARKVFPGKKADGSGKADREYWVETMLKIVEPVFVNLSQNTLKKNMPVETSILQNPVNRQKVTYLEAFGRSFCGIAPWLNLGPDDTKEGKLRARYIDLVIKSITNAVNPESPDYLKFGPPEKQHLVDAAHVALGLLHSKDVIWPALDEVTKQRLIDEFKSTRSMTPPPSNWLLFPAMMEAALLEFTGEYDEKPVKRAITKHEEWYKGDGWYGDGRFFNNNYYNSFVIHPFLVEITKVLKSHGKPYGELYDSMLTRIIRHSDQQERLISPDGTYPVMGRSMAYRFGAFHLLSHVSLMEKLPLHIEPSQVRCALTAVMKRQLVPETFDKDGWLRIGFCGHQPSVAERYVSTGSLYVCTLVFYPLGLPADSPFWSAPAAQWSSQRAWSGLPIRPDKYRHK